MNISTGTILIIILVAVLAIVAWPLVLAAFGLTLAVLLMNAAAGGDWYIRLWNQIRVWMR